MADLKKLEKVILKHIKSGELFSLTGIFQSYTRTNTDIGTGQDFEAVFKKLVKNKKVVLVNRHSIKLAEGHMKLAEEVNDLFEAKKLSKKALEKKVNGMYRKFATNVQIGIFDLSKVTDPAEKILLAGGSDAEAEKSVKDAVAKYRKN